MTLSVKSKILDKAFRLYDFRIVIRELWSIKLFEIETIVLSLMTKVFSFVKFSHNIKVDFRDSSKNWSREWRQQSRFFVKTMRNFCNVIKFYRQTNYFRFFNTISIQKSLSNNSSFIDEISLKPESNFLLKFFDVNSFSSTTWTTFQFFSINDVTHHRFQVFLNIRY